MVNGIHFFPFAFRLSRYYIKGITTFAKWLLSFIVCFIAWGHVLLPLAFGIDPLGNQPLHRALLNFLGRGFGVKGNYWVPSARVFMEGQNAFNWLNFECFRVNGIFLSPGHLNLAHGAPWRNFSPCCACAWFFMSHQVLLRHPPWPLWLCHIQLALV